MRLTQRFFLLLICSGLLCLLAACGSSASLSEGNPGGGIPPSTADFTLTASPATVNVTAGASGKTVAVDATAANGFTGNITVAISGLPAGVTATPSTLTLAPGTPQNVTLTASSTAASGNVTVTVTGTSGDLKHTANFALAVTAEPPPPVGDFTLAVNPATLTLTDGAAGQNISVSASPVNGFSGAVSVSIGGLPAGVTASPSTLTITPGTPQSVKLTAASNAGAGKAMLMLTGSSGSLSHQVTVALTVVAATPPPAADFSISTAPASLALTAEAAGKTVAVTAKAINGFTGTVTVTYSGLPSGVTASPLSLTLTPGTAQNVKFTAAASATSSTSTITLMGKSGGLSHFATLSLTVKAAVPPPAADFSLTINPVSLSPTAGGAGQVVSVAAKAINGFTGTVTVTYSGLPNGVTASPSSLSLAPGIAKNVTLTASSTAAAGSAAVTFQGVSGSLSHTATLSLTVKTATPPPVSGVDVTTYHYNNSRDGLNAKETILTQTNVNSASFGKIDFYTVDGKVDGEPLYLSSFAIGGKTRNVLYVVTEHDSVYAFDGDDGTQLWMKSVLGANERTATNGCSQISPEIGITSTPVIDRQYGAHGAIFVVGMSVDANGNYHQRLHGLDLTTGAELSGGPTEIAATYPGNGAFSKNGLQIFDPAQYAERVGLLLMNGTIYLGWTSHCDSQPYTGWLMAYSEQTLQQTSVLNLTPNSGGTGFGEGEGSIWMSGAGLAGDSSGNIYFLDANGGFDTMMDANGFPMYGDFGNAFMKVSTAGGKLAVADYFSDFDTVALSQDDRDLGSGGVLLLPDMTDASGKLRHLAVGAGKPDAIYVVDRDNMGKFNSSNNDAIYQELPSALAGSEFGMPAYFNSTIYYGSKNDVLRAFRITQAKLGTTPSSTSSASFEYPGATPSVSANGTQDGIVWAIENASSGAILHAYDATNLTHELYNSSEASNGRDSFVDNKFITPMIVNGKVYVGTPTGVAVFGLLNP